MQAPTVAQPPAKPLDVLYESLAAEGYLYSLNGRPVTVSVTGKRTAPYTMVYDRFALVSRPFNNSSDRRWGVGLGQAYDANGHPYPLRDMVAINLDDFGQDFNIASSFRNRLHSSPFHVQSLLVELPPDVVLAPMSSAYWEAWKGLRLLGAEHVILDWNGKVRGAELPTDERSLKILRHSVSAFLQYCPFDFEFRFRSRMDSMVTDGTVTLDQVLAAISEARAASPVPL